MARQPQWFFLQSPTAENQRITLLVLRLIEQFFNAKKAQ
jgi:hypothetical protein